MKPWSQPCAIHRPIRPRLLAHSKALSSLIPRPFLVGPFLFWLCVACSLGCGSKEKPPSKSQRHGASAAATSGGTVHETGVAGGPRKRCAPPQPGKMMRCQINDAVKREAVCNDGSPGVYYGRKGEGEGRSKWIIHLEGGGGASSIGELAVRWLTQHHRMTSKGYPPYLTGAGIFKKGPKDPFGRWNHVMIKYCSSDLHIGTGQIKSELTTGKTRGHDNPSQWLFRGKRIVMAVLEDLAKATPRAPGLENATEVILSGASAGGFGIVHNLDDMPIPSADSETASP